MNALAPSTDYARVKNNRVNIITMFSYISSSPHFSHQYVDPRVSYRTFLTSVPDEEKIKKILHALSKREARLQRLINEFEQVRDIDVTCPHTKRDPTTSKIMVAS